MAVVINEFEVVPDTEPPPRQAPAPAATTPPAPPAPHELATLLRLQTERLARVWAT